MKRNIRHIAGLMLFSFVMLSFAPASSVAQEKQSTIRKKELQSRIATARTPAEHRAIADYYRAESQHLAAKAREHEAMGAQYAKNPLPYESKFATGTVGTSHCRQWVAAYTKQSQEALSQANLHEDMARQAEGK
jgi:hypothetical protein